MWALAEKKSELVCIQVCTCIKYPRICEPNLKPQKKKKSFVACRKKMNLVMKYSLAEKYIFVKYIFHYNCNLVITTSQISHYNFTNLLCGSINRRICGLDFCYTSCDECVGKVIFTCICGGGRNMGRKGGWSEGAELSERGGANSGQSQPCQVEPDDCWALHVAPFTPTPFQGRFGACAW